MKTAVLLLFWGVAALTLSAATAADFYVLPSGSDDHPGTQAKPFTTIQAAVNRL